MKRGQYVLFSSKGCLGRVLRVKGTKVTLVDLCPQHRGNIALSLAAGNPVWEWQAGDVHVLE